MNEKIPRVQGREALVGARGRSPCLSGASNEPRPLGAPPQTPAKGLKALCTPRICFFLVAGLAACGGDEREARELELATRSAPEVFSQLRRSVAPLADGGFAVAWERGSGNDSDVALQWLDAEGRPVFERDGRGVAARPGREASVVLAPHPVAGVFLAYEWRRPDGLGEIRVQSYDGKGQARWAEAGVVAAAPADEEIFVDPQLTPDPAGGVFVCFGTYNPRFYASVRCQHLDEGGIRAWGEAGVEAGGLAGWRVLPRCVADGVGGLMVFWRNQRNPFDSVVEPMLMEGQHFSADRVRLWGEGGRLLRTTALAETNSHSFQFYDAVSDGAGGAVLAFNDWTGTSGLALDVFAQRVDAAGNLPWGAGGVPVVGEPGQQQHDATIAGPDGSVFVVAYEDQGLTRSRLRLFRLDAAGRHAWPAAGLDVSEPGSTALDFSTFGVFDGAELRLAWTRQQVPDTFEMDVLSDAWTLAGARRGARPLVSAPGGQFLRGLAWSPASTALLAVWEDLRPTGSFDAPDLGGLWLPDEARPEHTLARASDGLKRPESTLLRPRDTLARVCSGLLRGSNGLARPESTLFRPRDTLARGSDGLLRGSDGLPGPFAAARRLEGRP